MVVGIRWQVVPARAVDWTAQYEPARHRPPTGPTAAASPPWMPGQSTTEPGSPVQPGQTGQPGSTWPSGSPGQPGAQGQPPAYGPNAWPGSAPPVQPGYGATPYGATPYGATPYGATPYGQPVYVAPGGASTNGLAIASFVCSILGLFFFTFIVAIILGFVARAQIKNSARAAKRATGSPSPASSSALPGWPSTSW